MNKYDDKIKELEEQIAELEKEKLEYEALNIYQRTAIKAHDMFCRGDHAEECSWFYEIHDNVHDWNKPEHKRQLENANKLLKAGYHLSDLIKLNELGFKISV